MRVGSFDDPRDQKSSRAWITRDGNKVKIYVPVIYRGPAVTDDRIKQFEKNIKDKWGGKIGNDTVEVFFIPGGTKIGGGTILVGNIVYMEAAGPGMRSNFFYPTGVLAWNVDAPNAPGHEFGHLMRNSLHYDRDHDGYDNNIMVKSSGIVEPINIREGEDVWGGFRSQGFVPPAGIR